MTGLLTGFALMLLVVVPTAALFTWTVKTCVPLAERVLGMAERWLALQEKMALRPPPPKPEPMPVDMLQRCLDESEPWAREAALKRMYELYEDHGDWQRARTIWLTTA